MSVIYLPWNYAWILLSRVTGLDYTNIRDEAILELIALSQESALSELYDRYSRLIYSLAFNSLGDQDLAEEVTQDVFLRVWKKADTYRPDQGKVSLWLGSITRNRAIDVIRRLKSRPEGYAVPWALAESFDPPESVNVEKEVESSQQRQRVRLAITQLPEEQRQALAYAYFQGLTHREIANLLGEPLGTIKTRIRSAMQKLRQYLEDE
jgi:RNA polymerase sigma-70 factor (ECF subfamily)